MLPKEGLDDVGADSDGALRSLHGGQPTGTDPPPDSLGMNPECLGDFLGREEFYAHETTVVSCCILTQAGSEEIIRPGILDGLLEGSETGRIRVIP